MGNEKAGVPGSNVSALYINPFCFVRILLLRFYEVNK